MSHLPVIAPRPLGLGPRPQFERPAPREHTEAEWESYRGLLGRLYLQENRKLGDIMSLLASKHGFVATWVNRPKWDMRKRPYRKSTRGPAMPSCSESPESQAKAEPDEEVKEIPESELPLQAALTRRIRPSTPVDFAAMENILCSVQTWSNGKLDARQVVLDPMSRYLANPDQPPIQDSRTMYRTFELVYELWRCGRGDLAGMAARKAFYSLEFVLTEDHPDLVWHILDTVYDMLDQQHLQLLEMFLQHADELVQRQLPRFHPLVRILRQVKRFDHRTEHGRQAICYLLRQAWLRNVEIMGEHVGSVAPQHFWLYEQLIWDGRTRLRKDSGLSKKQMGMLQALGKLAGSESAGQGDNDTTRLRTEALRLEFTQMDLGDKARAEHLAEQLLQHTDSSSSRPLDDRFHAYARKMLARIYEEKGDWQKAEENLQQAVIKREAAHGAVNNLRVVRDMWVLAAHYRRAGRPDDADRITQDALSRAEQFLLSS
ncbi:hypothetical protein S40285_01887, partial [Stachybotrys chlorohalonatus IBT 40285]